MKKMLLLVWITLLLWSGAAYAFTSGSTGADGPFNPTANTVVTLPPNGVLNYTTINIPSGVTVTFLKNAANTPVYMLATGDVTIAGTISVNGSNGTSIPGQGGPGGFNGAYGCTMVDLGGIGLGPGGGSSGTFSCVWNGSHAGGGGGFATAGASGCGTGGGTYGNAKLIPLIGGSGGGGGGGASNPVYSGGGGGGAILIASSGSIIFSGVISANGGSGYAPLGAGGSGGGIRLIANTISGSGNITALGSSCSGNCPQGGVGRIRLEAYTNNNTISANPAYSFSNTPGNVFPPAPPSLTITSIAGYSPPATPTGSYSQPDIPLPSSTINPITVNVSASNIPDGTTVTILSIPQYGSATSANPILSNSTASASVNISTTYSSIITAQATFTVVGMNYNGEEIDKVRVATSFGGKSETTYITKSGKEFKGELIAALSK